MIVRVVEGTYGVQGTVSGTDQTVVALTNPEEHTASNVLRVWVENPTEPFVPNALVGVDGVTVTSGDPIDTISGFRAEFLSASGTLVKKTGDTMTGPLVVEATVSGTDFFAGDITATGTITVDEVITVPDGGRIELYTGVIKNTVPQEGQIYVSASGALSSITLDTLNTEGGPISLFAGTDVNIWAGDDVIVNVGDICLFTATNDIRFESEEADIEFTAGAGQITLNDDTYIVGSNLDVDGTITAPTGTFAESLTVSGEPTVTGSVIRPVDFLSNLENAYDGSVGIRESQTYAVSSDGSDITFTLDDGQGDPSQPVQISGTNIEHALPDTVILTAAGADTNPQENWIFLEETDPQTLTLTTNTVGFPATPHARVARVIVQTAATVQTSGPLKLHAYTDHLSEPANRGSIGHIHAISERIRAQWAEWQSGTALTYTVDAGPSPDDITIQVTEGLVYQLHNHATPEWDTSGSDLIFLLNHFTDPYSTIQSLSEIDEYSDGSPVGNTDRFNLVFWGTCAENDSDAKLFVNLPTDGYNNDTNAINDVNNTAIYSVPKQYAGTAWLLAKLTVKRAVNTWTILQNTDLRGGLPSSFPGGIVVGGAGVTDHALLTNLSYAAAAHTGFASTEDTSALAASGVATDANVTTNAADIATTVGDTSALAASGVATDAQVTANLAEFISASGTLVTKTGDTMTGNLTAPTARFTSTAIVGADRDIQSPNVFEVVGDASFRGDVVITGTNAYQKGDLVVEGEVTFGAASGTEVVMPLASHKPQLHILNTENNFYTFATTQYDNIYGPQWIGLSARGSQYAPDPVDATHNPLAIQSWGWTGTKWGMVGNLNFHCDGAVSAENIPGKITFAVHTGGIASDSTTVLTIDSSTNATFAGDVNAVTGDFSGNVEAVDGDFTGTVTAPTGTYSESLTVSGEPVATGTSFVPGDYVAKTGDTMTGALVMDEGSITLLGTDSDLSVSGTTYVRKSLSFTDVALGRDDDHGLAFRHSGDVDYLDFVLSGVKGGTATQYGLTYKRFYSSTSSAANPPVTYTSDTNTGLHFRNDDSFALVGGGTEIVTVSGKGDATDGAGVEGNLTVTGSVGAHTGAFSESLTVSGVAVPLGYGAGEAVDSLNTFTGDVTIDTVIDTMTVISENNVITISGIAPYDGNFRGAIANLTTTTGILHNTSSKIYWDTEVYDTDDFFDASETAIGSTKFTIPAGITKVRLSAQAEMATDSAGDRQWTVLKNGAFVENQLPLDWRNAPSGTALYASTITSGPVEVLEGDYFEAQVYQNSGSALDFTGTGRTWFSLEVLEPNTIFGESGTFTESLTISGAAVTTGTLSTRAISVEVPGEEEDLTLFYSNRDFTLRSIQAVVVGSGVGFSSSWTIRHDPERWETGTEIITGGTTTTASGVGDRITTFNSPTIPSDSWVWLETTGVVQTVNMLTITLYGEDAA